MVKHSPSVGRLEDPYSLLALTMLDEALRNIKCYYNNIGSKEEIVAGKQALRWIRKMEGNFRMVAIAANVPLNNFHQMCIWKINKIRDEALATKKENERKRLEGKSK